LGDVSAGKLSTPETWARDTGDYGVPPPCSTPPHTQLPHSIPLLINDTSPTSNQWYQLPEPTETLRIN